MDKSKWIERRTRCIVAYFGCALTEAMTTAEQDWEWRNIK